MHIITAITLQCPLPETFWPDVHRACSGKAWPPSPPEVETFLEHCASHGILPVLFREPGLPSTVQEGLAGRRVWRALFDHRGQRYRQAVAEVDALLQGQTFLYLKGVDYAEHLYGDFALRPMSDVDVLVPAAQFEATCERVAAAAEHRFYFPPPAARDAAFHERAYVFGDWQLEVHQSFLQRPRNTVDYEALWGRVRRDPRSGRPRLDPVDALAYHALSMGCDQFVVPLRRYLDLWLLMHVHDGVLAAAAERAREWSAARAFYGMLHQARRLFRAFDTDEVRAAAERVLPRNSRRFLDRFVLPDPRRLLDRRLPPRATQLWRKFALMDGVERRLAFVAYHVRADLKARWQLRQTEPSADTAHS
jgi:hypothetical protein